MKFSCCGLDKNQIIDLSNTNYECDEIISIFKTIAHPIRLQILQILAVEPEICTCELTDIMDEAQPAITKQLTKLKKEKLITSRKITFKSISEGQWEKEDKEDGKWTAYRLTKGKEDIVRHLLKPFIKEKYSKNLKKLVVVKKLPVEQPTPTKQ
ncbi:MAG: ArsR/SmtB family transcription factor [Candidatus Hodarchaeales archaeon]|jgi:DNA-binding transcriptional ArsR family regulator